MPNKPHNESSKLTQALYQITVRGKLREDWQDWFNGMLIATEGLAEAGSGTTFFCKVQDQAELVGIINWLHEMNMVIEQVCLIPSDSEHGADRDEKTDRMKKGC